MVSGQIYTELLTRAVAHYRSMIRHHNTTVPSADCWTTVDLLPVTGSPGCILGCELAGLYCCTPDAFHAFLVCGGLRFPHVLPCCTFYWFCNNSLHGGPTPSCGLFCTPHLHPCTPPRDPDVSRRSPAPRFGLRVTYLPTRCFGSWTNIRVGGFVRTPFHATCSYRARR